MAIGLSHLSHVLVTSWLFQQFNAFSELPQALVGINSLSHITTSVAQDTTFGCFVCF